MLPTCLICFNQNNFNQDIGNWDVSNVKNGGI